MVTKIACLLIIITHRIHSMREGNVFTGVCHSGDQVHGLVGVWSMVGGGEGRSMVSWFARYRLEIEGTDQRWADPPTHPLPLAERIGTESRGRIAS